MPDMGHDLLAYCSLSYNEHVASIHRAQDAANSQVAALKAGHLGRIVAQTLMLVSRVVLDLSTSASSMIRLSSSSTSWPTKPSFLIIVSCL